MKKLVLVVLLSGCASNELCVQRGVFVGDEVEYQGKRAEVVALSGESVFCRVETHPNMAEVKFK